MFFSTLFAMQQNSLKEYRCSCGKLLCKALLLEGVLELKCKNCREIVRFSTGPAGDQKTIISGPTHLSRIKYGILQKI